MIVIELRVQRIWGTVGGEDREYAEADIGHGCTISSLQPWHGFWTTSRICVVVRGCQNVQ